ncbi:TonB-dependent receptor plug domain-containing protein [Pedobacter sp. Leaf170]|uniref:TonB-dependent receptor plug domain-containing protein n=1 Tax=Pedobacter sp. Leaf170 TaxID=2876558 RepID=UPI001E4496A5|nr:TonB-dependent receptor plug domain-containing protein [Pedobacter sp. Leaf170]
MKKIFFLAVLISCLATAGIAQTKADSANVNSVNIIIRNLGDSTSKRPLLYVIDGVKQFDTDFTIKKLNPNDIKAITVLKNDKGSKLFGNEGNNGVVLVTTKFGLNSPENTLLRARIKALNTYADNGETSKLALKGDNLNDSSKVRIYSHNAPFKGINAGKQTNQPLYIVDGEKVESASIELLDPNTIQSVTVLKDKDSIISYGLAASNGVVLITTKATKKALKSTEPDQN